MNEELNLVEILKNVPKGTKFWSSAYGNVRLVYVSDVDGEVIICNLLRDEVILTKDGTLYKGYGECILFPSKDQRDWSKFKVDLHECTKVMCSSGRGWNLRYYACDKKCYDGGKKTGNTTDWDYIVPVSDFDFTNLESNINKSI